ncbi:MAG: tRNA (adenosine(37)-N6)-threonylcarbamoyltransferase complex transferase subunit TsaD [Candidatus Micrarchaeales archaeon]
MAILGIESSAHTLGIGIVDKQKVLANERSMYKISNKGLIPARVADYHADNLETVLTSALKASDLKIDDIEAIGYTKGPGLGACLQVGMIAAKSLSERYNLPIFPINHAVAHVEITKTLFGMKDPLALYVSGGNSQILATATKPYRHYHIYGETFDIGVGNMLDTFARAAKLNPPWGSTVARKSIGGRYISMPYTVKGMDFTFTGLMTHAEGMLGKKSISDIAYSLQETAFSMLCEATERALFLTKKRELILCGGVAQSKRLREMLKEVSRSHKIMFGVAPDEFNADNGAMIALVAERLFRSGYTFSESEITINQRYRIDRTMIL